MAYTIHTGSVPIREIFDRFKQANEEFEVSLEVWKETVSCDECGYEFYRDDYICPRCKHDNSERIA